MKRLFFCLPFIIFGSTAFASSSSNASTIEHSSSDMLNRYLDYIHKYPNTLLPLGNASQGEIEIILDKEKIAEIEQKTNRKVGVLAEDNYWLWFNDAVKFPNGKCGVYGRMLWRKSMTGTAGVAVMAILPDGKIVLNRNFRHTMRSWEYELPRGVINHGETTEDAASREVKEETGMIIDQLANLGQLATDTGITNTIASVYLAKVVAKQDATPEDSEAIAAIEAFSLEELKQGFIDGYLTISMDGEVRKIALRDPFLSFALFQADIRNLLPKKS